MKRRNLRQMFALDVLTLGGYELYWLFQTRKEMISSYKVQIPPLNRVALARGATILVFALSLWSLHLAVTPRPYVARPTPECLIDYSIYHEQGTARRGNVLDPSCEKAVDRYYADDHQVLWLELFGAGLVVLLLLGWLSTKWLIPYMEAVEKVLGGRSAETTALYVLFFFKPIYGMIALQSRFNRLAKLN